MNHTLSKWILTFALFCQGASLSGREPYHALVTVNKASEKVSDPNLVDLKRSLGKALVTLSTDVPPLSPAAIDINLRGIFLLNSFAANSTALVLEIPQANIVETFDGGTREASLILLKDFIRDGGTNGRLFRAYAKFSPIDPIAGNPNSLMSQMAQADYLLGHLSPLSGCNCCWSAQPVIHQFQAGSYVGRAFSNGFDTTIVTLPIRYSFSPNQKWAFILDAPLSYFRNGGASSLFGSLAMGLRLPITSFWALTSTLRFGAGGTMDLCTAGAFVSPGLLSTIDFKVSDYVLSMTNYAGYTSSVNVWLTGINFNYHLHNYIFKNGIAITTCQGFNFCKRPFNLSLGFIDTAFSRGHLFINHYDEINVSLITNNVNPLVNYDSLSLQLAFQYGQRSYKGYFFNLTYQF